MSEARTHILLLEDSPADVVLLRQALDKHLGECGYQLQVLSDGAQGMRYLNSGGDPVPDLIVLDINLPVYSGLEILSRLRQQQMLPAVPIAVLTTSDSRYEREQAERLGVACFIRKPANLDDFIAVGAKLKSCLRES